jgi:hypothetical protein
MSCHCVMRLNARSHVVQREGTNHAISSIAIEWQSRFSACEALSTAYGILHISNIKKGTLVRAARQAWMHSIEFGLIDYGAWGS